MMFNCCLQWFDIVGCSLRKSIQPVKLQCGAGVVICLDQGANDLHMVQLMPVSLVISNFIKFSNAFLRF